MKKFKYYILTSNDVNLLKRHISEEWSNIAKENVVVVINTTSDDYEREAEKWCKDEGIEYHITESNGTPARGKNSVIELFLKSDNDYMVMVDGDDFITPHGTVFFSQLAKMDSPPDAITMRNQWGSMLKPEAFIGRDQVDSNGSFKVSYYRPFSIDDWDTFLPELERTMALNLRLRFNMDYDRSVKYTKESVKYYEKQKIYSEPHEVHCRVTWLSRKAVEAHKFPENLVIGEDTIFYYKLKNDAVNGKLDFKVHNEVPVCTYVYDQVSNGGGAVATESNYGENLDWQEKFNEELEQCEREGILHANKPLPSIQVKYPDDYTPYVNLIK